MGDERLLALIDLAREMVAGRFGDIARELEDEIERRGLQHEYLNCLVDLDPNISTRVDEVFTTFDGLWRILRATPEQRARAFLEVIR